MKICSKLLIHLLVIAICFLLPAAARAEDTDATAVFNDNASYCFKAIRKLATIPTKDHFSIMQGGGTDRKYAYYAMVASTKYSIYSLIYKFDMENWECVAISEPLSLGHANDITYDPENNRLLVAHTNSQVVCYVDPETLCDMGYDITLISFSRLEYLYETGQVLVGTGYTIGTYRKQSWKNIDNFFDCKDKLYVTQGLTSDGVYVYDLRWNDSQYEASLTDDTVICDYIVVHDLRGHYFGSYPVYGLEGEPENIIWLGGKTFAVGCNVSNSVYLVELCLSE